MRKLNGQIAVCGNCECVMEYDETDIIPAVECPECKALVRVRGHFYPHKTLEEMSFKEIHELISLNGAKALPLGATKEITLKNGEKYILQVADRKDKYPILCFKDLYGNNENGGRSMNDTHTTEGGYAKSKIREWLNSDFFELLPDDLREFIVPTTIKVGNKTVDDMVFLASEYEIFGKRENGTGKEGVQFELFADWHNRIAGYPDGEYGRWYWLRTPASSTSFCLCYGDGGACCNYAGISYGVRPFFSIK